MANDNWQIGDATAILASVLASRYIGTKAYHIVPAGFTLLGIAYGVSFASSSFNAINEEKMTTVMLPLIPALFLIGIGRTFPMWERIFSAFVCVPFFFVYNNVISGTYAFENLSNTLAYTGIQILGIVWSFYLWRMYKADLE